MNVWVIFITSFDPFSKNRMVYTIRNLCEEDPEMEYDDGARTIFLNVKGEAYKCTEESGAAAFVYGRHHTGESM